MESRGAGEGKTGRREDGKKGGREEGKRRRREELSLRGIARSEAQQSEAIPSGMASSTLLANGLKIFHQERHVCSIALRGLRVLRGYLSYVRLLGV